MRPRSTRSPQAAGYTKGAVYSNFAAKEDVFFAVYERRMERAVAEIERTLAASDDPAGWIESVIADTSRRRGRDDRWLSTFFEFWAHVDPAPGAARALRDHPRARRRDRSSWRSSATPTTTGRGSAIDARQVDLAMMRCRSG